MPECEDQVLDLMRSDPNLGRSLCTACRNLDEPLEPAESWADYAQELSLSRNDARELHFRLNEVITASGCAAAEGRLDRCSMLRLIFRHRVQILRNC
jgi:hypothetical protein